MSTRSPSHPALDLQRSFKGIGSNTVQRIVAHQRSCDAADGAKILTRKKTYFSSINLTSRHRQLFDLPSQQSNALLSRYPIPQTKLWLTQKSQAESNDAKILVWTWTNFLYRFDVQKSLHDLFRSHIRTVRSLAQPIIDLHSILWLTQTNRAESHIVKILARTGTYFSDIDFTSGHHYVT